MDTNEGGEVSVAVFSNLSREALYLRGAPSVP